MSQTKDQEHKSPVPTTRTTMERWFPIGALLPSYNLGKLFSADLIAAVSRGFIVDPGVDWVRVRIPDIECPISDERSRHSA